MKSTGDYENTSPKLIKDMKTISEMGDRIENTVGINITIPYETHQTNPPYDVMDFLEKVTKTVKGKNPGRLYGPKDSLFRREITIRQKIQLASQGKAKANSMKPKGKIIELIKNSRAVS